MVLSGADSDMAAYPRPNQIAAIAESVESAELAGQGHLAHTYDAPAFLQAVQRFVRLN